MRPHPTGEDLAAGGGPAAGVLVVGYGNPLRSDDGVGPAVAERLAGDARMAGAEIRMAHQLTPELALDASGARLLILIDAAENVPPGEIAVRELGMQRSAGVAGGEPGGESAGRFEEGGPPLTHHVDPAELLAVAEALWGSAPRTVLIGVGPESLELGESLTPAVATAIDRVVELVAEVVAGR